MISSLRFSRMSFSNKSHLFTTRMQARRFSTIRSAIFLSCSKIPASASRTRIAISQREMDSSERCTLKNSTESSMLRVLRMPAVSTSTYFSRPPSVSTSNGTSTESRVVPGIGLTMTRSDFVSALMMDDLPTFGRPTIANRNGPFLRRTGAASSPSTGAEISASGSSGSGIAAGK